MFLAVEPQTSGVYILLHTHGIFTSSERLIRARKSALHDENAILVSIKAPQHGQLGLLHRQCVPAAVLYSE